MMLCGAAPYDALMVRHPMMLCGAVLRYDAYLVVSGYPMMSLWCSTLSMLCGVVPYLCFVVRHPIDCLTVVRYPMTALPLVRLPL